MEAFGRRVEGELRCGAAHDRSAVGVWRAAKEGPGSVAEVWDWMDISAEEIRQVSKWSFMGDPLNQISKRSFMDDPLNS